MITARGWVGVLDPGPNIKQARKRAGLSVIQLATLLGVTKSAVYQWENGQTSPGTRMLSNIPEVLQVSVNELLPTVASRATPSRLRVDGRRTLSKITGLSEAKGGSPESASGRPHALLPSDADYEAALIYFWKRLDPKDREKLIQFA